MSIGQFVHIEQRLVDCLLQLQCRLQRVQTRPPIIGRRLGDVLKHDTTATHVLVIDQLGRVFTFFLRLLIEVLRVTFESRN